MPRLRDVLPTFGLLSPGHRNAITDVPGIRVGHATVSGGRLHTGVTAIIPGAADAYRNKVTAATGVLNGYGKSVGLMQLEELGTLETPILLTSTLNVPRVADALLTILMDAYPEIGDTETVNPVVLECFDGYLNDARARAVGEFEVRAALAAMSSGPVAEGAVGAGTGMRCMGYKSGIGTASRVTAAGHALGLLVVPNFGFPGDLLIAGVPVGRELHDAAGAVERVGEGRGSCVFVVATDAPLPATDLRRLAWRCFLGMARTGGISGWTSGDLAVAFTVSPVQSRIERTEMNQLFRAVVETSEEAILNALFMAETTTGRDGHEVKGLPLAHVGDILRRHGVEVR